MASIELFLSNIENPRLERFSYVESPSHPPMVVTRSNSTSYQCSYSDNIFTWTAAVRALTLLSIVTALNNSDDMSLTGEEQSPAASLDYAISKEPGWLLDFFGITPNGKALAKQLFLRKNTERKQPGPVDIRYDPNRISPSDIKIYLDGALIDSRNTLNELRRELELQAARASGKGRKSLTVDSEEAREASASRFIFPEASLICVLDPARDRMNLRFVYRIKNIGAETVDFFHWNRLCDAQFRYDEVVVTSDDRQLEANLVSHTELVQRYIIRLRKPLKTGEEDTVMLTYNFMDSPKRSGDLAYFLLTPTDKLNLELHGNAEFALKRHTIIGNRDEAVLFGELPDTNVTQNPDGSWRVIWSMEKPPQGCDYHLHWAIEERANKHTFFSQPYDELGWLNFAKYTTP